MESADVLLLSNEPLPETETTITFELFETATRGSLSPKKELEGKITCNPNQCHIFSLPEGTTHPLLMRDRTKWNLYLIMVPFTLHQASENGYYQEVTFFMTFQDQNINVLDLFPQAVNANDDTTGVYTLTFASQDTATGKSHTRYTSRQIQFPVRPTITTGGEGEDTFYWLFKGFADQKEVIPETKHALFILQVPRETGSIVGTISYEMKIVKKRLGILRSIESESDQIPIRWDLHNAPDFFGKQSPISQKGTHNTAHLAFDVCVLCALPEEAHAFREMAERLYGLRFQRAFSEQTERDYLYVTMLNNEGESLLLHLSWLPSYGPEEVALHFKPVLKECQPRFAAMTGICAGDRRKVSLGDIIIADRAFLYDTGKFVLNIDGQQEHLHDTTTRGADPGVLQFVQMFEYWDYLVTALARPPSRRQQRDWLLSRLLEPMTSYVDTIPMQELAVNAPDWKALVSTLQSGPQPWLTTDRRLFDPARVQELYYSKEIFPFKDAPRPACYTKPMASGNAVRADNPFDQVRIPVRGTIAIDMEGATFYRTVADFPGIRSLLVKAVCDYADSDKDDSYHQYAAQVSALYMLAFLKEYVGNMRIPRLF